MSPDILFVKNMIGHRCVLAVEGVLKNPAIPFQKVIAGEIHLAEKLSPEKNNLLRSGLAGIGLELIENRMSGLIERIKQLVIKKTRNKVREKERKTNLPVYLSENLHHEYTYLSSFFSLVEGRTIENYFIGNVSKK